LICIFHPWETGCDDSPRWDSWSPNGWEVATWRAAKVDFVAALEFDQLTRSPIGSTKFQVGSVVFSSLVAFNALELADTLDAREAGSGAGLRSDVSSLVADIDRRWDPDRRTFADGGERVSSNVRVVEALLPVLVVGDGAVVDDAFGQLQDAAAFGAGYGPTQVHRSEPAFDPVGYWRGPAWPQLSYLLWVAARRQGREDVARRLRDATVRGAVRSGFAEYWHPDTGEGYGAAPQSWTALAAVMAGAGDDPPAPRSSPRR
jgi:hypothetical protein